jgi:hypothetical protein
VEIRAKARVTRSVGVAAGLSAERRYTAITLRRGVIRSLTDALKGDPAALARCAASTVGLLSATTGYAVGTVQGGLADLRRPEVIS